MTATGGVFSNPTLLPISEIGEVVDANATETGNGLTLYFDSGRPRRRIWRATRERTSDAYQKPEEVTALDVPQETMEPYVLPDGSAIYFVANNPLAQTEIVFEIFWASISESGKVSDPQKLELTNLNGNVRAPVLSADGTELYFASSPIRPPLNYDIWVAKRRNVDSPFGEPKKAPHLNSNVHEFPSYMTPDGCELYLYGNNVKGSQSTFKVLRARRPPKFK
jgi:hypothetical protein